MTTSFDDVLKGTMDDYVRNMQKWIFETLPLVFRIKYAQKGLTPAVDQTYGPWWRVIGPRVTECLPASILLGRSYEWWVLPPEDEVDDCDC